jgi:hypothetical protein
LDRAKLIAGGRFPRTPGEMNKEISFSRRDFAPELCGTV